MKPSPGRDETPAVPRPLLPIAAAALIAVLAAGCGASHQATATTTAPDGRTTATAATTTAAAPEWRVDGAHHRPPRSAAPGRRTRGLGRGRHPARGTDRRRHLLERRPARNGEQRPDGRDAPRRAPRRGRRRARGLRLPLRRRERRRAARPDPPRLRLDRHAGREAPCAELRPDGRDDRRHRLHRRRLHGHGLARHDRLLPPSHDAHVVAHLPTACATRRSPRRRAARDRRRLAPERHGEHRRLRVHARLAPRTPDRALPAATTHAAAAAIGDLVYVIGGRGASLDTPTARIVAIDVRRRTVRAAGALRSPRSDLDRGRDRRAGILVAGGTRRRRRPRRPLTSSTKDPRRRRQDRRAGPGRADLDVYAHDGAEHALRPCRDARDR